VNIAQPIALHARYIADKPALIERDRVMTFAELGDAVARTAAHFSSLGVRPGDNVAVALQEHIGTPIVWFGLARLGARMLPMDWRWMLPEQQGFIDTFRPRLMLVEPDRRVPENVSITVHDKAWRDAVVRADPAFPMAPGGDAPATVYITSGTTGVSKAYSHSHTSFLDVMVSMWLGLDVGPADRCLSTMPLAYTAGRSIGMATLLRGGTFVVHPAFTSARDVLTACARHRINAMTCAPGLLRGLLDLAPESGLLLPEFRRLVSVGAQLFPEEIRRIRATVTPHLVNYYGSSGSGSISSIGGDELDRKPGSVGRPMYGVEIQIVDDDGRVLPSGETGWLRSRGPGAAIDIDPPDLDDRTFRGGWHYPGDYAVIDKDGFIFLQGRDADMINVGGVVVFAPEIERAMAACPLVREAAVAGRPTATGDEEIVAAVVAQPGATPDAIVAHCRQHLASYKRPRHVRLVDSLPRNSNGKVVKDTLLALFDAP
jgi:acyl-coenzyme A synthetase/AMP-(fatty) acid ligase